MTVGDTTGILPSVSNCRQLWQVAKRCSWQRPVARSSLLVQPSRHVQLLLQSLNLENCFLLSAVLSSDLAFSLPLSLSLRTFLLQQGLLTTLAYPCAFSQSVFTHGLSSSHQISHFWSSLGHNGHCCVFFGLFWAFWDPESQQVGIFCVHRHRLFTCSSSESGGGLTATAVRRSSCGIVRRRAVHSAGHRTLTCGHVRPALTAPSSPAAAASKLDLQLRKCISLSLSLVWKLQI